MKVRRLSWAGIQIESCGTALFVDPLEDVAQLPGFLGTPHAALVPIEVPSRPASALVTHLHPDHYDPETLRKIVAEGGRVYCHDEISDKVQADGLPVVGVSLEKAVQLGSFEVRPVSAQDWLGHDQVSWIVSCDGRRLFHGGDTLWHGYWWRIARKYGPFDVAFLPINGVIAAYPGLEPSGLPATLTPAQAAVAARLLHARALCPIHYGTFNNPPVYVEQDDPLSTLAEAAAHENVDIWALQDGEWIDSNAMDNSTKHSFSDSEIEDGQE